MSSNEALRLRMDKLQAKNQELEVQLRKLRAERPDCAVETDIENECDSYKKDGEAAREENDRLKQLYEQLLRDSQEAESTRNQEKEHEKSSFRAMEERCAELAEEFEHAKQTAELERLRAAEQEWIKWECQEERLVEQLSHLEEQVKDSQQLLDPAGISSPTSNIIGENRSLPMTESVSPRSLRESVGCHYLPISMLSSTAPACVSPTTLSGFLGSSHTATSMLPNAMSGSVLPTPSVGSMGSDPIPTPVLSTPLSVSVSSVQSANSSVPAFSDPLTTPPVPTPLSFTSPGATMPSAQAGTSMVSTTWLGQQLPPLNAFTGDDYNDSNAETFEEWMERFDLVAAMGRWDEPAKLANLVTRLKGSAFAYFRSCHGEKGASTQPWLMH